MNEFVFGVDLDGVCGDYTNGLRKILAEKLGVPVDSLAKDVSWDCHEWGISPAEYQVLHTEAVVQRRLFAVMDVIPGCAEALWKLSDAGVWIRILTHRLFLNHGHAVAVSDTCTWLDAHNIPYRDLCFLGNKPQVEANIYVDDAPHNIISLQKGGSDVIIFEQHYNKDLPGLRAGNWGDVESIVLSKLDKHKNSI